MEADRSDQRPEGGPEDDFVDVEAYAMRGQPVPAARSYRYRVNKQQLVSGKAVLTREEILVSAGKTPVELYRLLIKKPGQSMPVEVKPGEQVNLRGPGVERFIAQHTEVQDGREARRQFALPAEDAAFLDGLGLRWEAVREGEGLWVIIYGLPLPEDVGSCLAPLPCRARDQVQDHEGVARPGRHLRDNIDDRRQTLD